MVVVTSLASQSRKAALKVRSVSTAKAAGIVALICARVVNFAERCVVVVVAVDVVLRVVDVVWRVVVAVAVVLRVVVVDAVLRVLVGVCRVRVRV